MKLPPGAVSPRLTRVLLAVAAVHRRDGRCTVEAAAEAAGYASKGAVHRTLAELRQLGLVTWEDGRDATLRPTLAKARRGAA